MATKTDLATSAQRIEEALRGLGLPQEAVEVHVFESSPGSFRAILATDAFKGVGLAERQERLWRHLRKSVDPQHLRCVLGVHAYDLDEFERLFPGGSAAAVATFASQIRKEAS